MTEKETLDQHVDAELTNRWVYPVLDAVLSAMRCFARQKVKEVDVNNIVDRSPDFKTWWATQDDVNRCLLIKNKAIEINRLHKKMVKASDGRMEYGFNRVGIRGGKFTSLAAHEERCTHDYLEAVKDFKYMTITL